MGIYKNTLNNVKNLANQKVAGELLVDRAKLFKQATKNRPFPDKLEEHYQDYRNYKFLKGNHRLMVFGVLVYASFLPIDILLYSHLSLYPFISRTVLIFLIITYYLRALKTSSISYFPISTMVFIALGSVQSLAVAIILQSPANHLFLIGQAMFLIFGICILRLFFKELSFLSIFILSFYSLYLYFFSTINSVDLSFVFIFQDYRTLILILLAVVALVGSYTTWLAEQTHRKEWLQKQISQNKTIKQSELVDILNRQSLTDGLTQLFNRRHFDIEFSRLWDWHVKQKKSLSIIMLDLDWFKPYNDNYGHQRGDDCLVEVAGLLKRSVKLENLHRSHPKEAETFIARYGGEEFIILTPNTSIKQAQAFAQSLCDTIYNEKIEHKYSPLGVCSASLGISSVDKPTDYYKELDMTQLLKLADDASYLAKERGKNCVVLMTELPDV